MPRWSAAALVTAGLVIAGSAHAQIPGDELPSVRRAREEYLAVTFGEVKDLVTRWGEHVASANARDASRLFTVDGFYSPPFGWYVQGRETIADTLATRLAQIQGYHTSFLDFAASGNLAYYLGRLRYRLGGPEPVDVAGTFVMVLYLDGRNWRIRSYVERAG